MKKRFVIWLLTAAMAVLACGCVAGDRIGGNKTDHGTPFYYGEKTAAEVADIIDNRVQLYLDEGK